MVNGKMCVAVNNRPDHVLMVRIDAKNQEALSRKGASLAVMRGKPMPGWIYLTREAIATPADFEYWINLALAHNLEAEK